MSVLCARTPRTYSPYIFPIHLGPIQKHGEGAKEILTPEFPWVKSDRRGLSLSSGKLF